MSWKEVFVGLLKIVVAVLLVVLIGIVINAIMVFKVSK
jgi:hypothetical protein